MSGQSGSERPQGIRTDAQLERDLRSRFSASDFRRLNALWPVTVSQADRRPAGWGIKIMAQEIKGAALPALCAELGVRDEHGVPMLN